MVAHDTLLAWENFYIIVGSSAGTLTGLQFVVMALAAETEVNTDTGEVDAFGTPTIVHFCAVLLVSAILSMPWSEISLAAAVVGICGALGIGYTLIVIRRAGRTKNYKPERDLDAVQPRSRIVWDRYVRAAGSFHRHPQRLGLRHVYGGEVAGRAEGGKTANTGISRDAGTATLAGLPGPAHRFVNGNQRRRGAFVAVAFLSSGGTPPIPACWRESRDFPQTAAYGCGTTPAARD